MGFFSGLVGGILGGGQQSSGSSSGTFKSGFASLPKELQKPYTQYGTQLSDAFANNPVQTPNADQTQGFNLARQGVAATPESLQRDLSMLMNPYDQYVINDINREATGQNSLVNQYATQAGQQGSNRSFLGTSDVEQNRLNNIGKFRQDQYNTSVNNILGPLAQARQGDISSLLNIGQQQQDMPYNNLQKYAELLGVVPNGTNLTQTGGTTSGSQGNSFGNVLGNLGSIGSFFFGK